MKIEEQVSSLEFSKELRKLGVEQDGLYSYFQYDKWNAMLRETREIFSPNNEYSYNKDNLICSAFTVAELGEKLPDGFHSIKFNQIHRIEYNNDYIKAPRQADNSEADARAKMLIYLIKNKLIIVAE